MCGIIGYAGHRPAVTVVIEGLKRLEYRGYDSAGVAFVQNKCLETVRSEGKLERLEQKLSRCDPYLATTGMGHTRWATHGLPNEQNAHPHQDQSGRLALVHNGIIENYLSLKDQLEQEGVEFQSETDTEVLVQLIGWHMHKDGLSLQRAISRALEQVEGAYALAVFSTDNPDQLWAVRNSSPLLLGVGQGENFVASDIPAFLNYTREVVFLDDHELVLIQPHSWQVYDSRNLEPVTKAPEHITWDVQSAQKSGYKHFMLKEILEQPQVIRDCLAGRIDRDTRKVVLKELEGWEVPTRVHIVACGTSFHAGLWAKYYFERWSGLSVQVDIASEFRYREPILKPGELVVVISQSGETADTLAGLRIAREKKVPVLGICNVLGSTVARESDLVLYTQAGPEISVASTKAMCSQMVALILLTLYWGQAKGTVSSDFSSKALKELESLPELMQAGIPGMHEQARSLARKYSVARSFFFLGRGENYPLALEGALKLKEISYIHAEGYAAGEMKHGPIALIDQDFPTFALVTDNDLLQKLQSNLQEVQARGGPVIALTSPGVEIRVADRWEVPKVWSQLAGFFILPALQLFAYEMAVYLGKDVDQPRNLAKSVTVE
ncbi:MAG: glutamine--fructose-6-phosphate transaminase (isomerizing) [Desulfohalobiaceae bacterium]|nr:glutamine--fructose-6-phosphate transaminase (isomerizing) [Desulfohalobiaceae bacterium]